MAGKPQPMSTFAIRFNTASAVDDDDDELYDFTGNSSNKPRKEALQFERRSVSPPPGGGADVTGGENDAVAASDTTLSIASSHPTTLWKNSFQPVVRSAPVSEVTSPMSPTGSNVPSPGEAAPTTKDAKARMVEGPPLAAKEERSIFTELREKLENKSREILPRRLHKSGSIDPSKVTTKDDKGPVEKEMSTIKSRSRPGSDAGEALAKEILKAGGSIEFLNGDLLESLESSEDAGGALVRRSSSVGQINEKKEPSCLEKDDLLGSTPQTFNIDSVSMSELLSVKEKDDDDDAEDERQSPATEKNAEPARSKLRPVAIEKQKMRYVRGLTAPAKALMSVPALFRRRSVVALVVLLVSLFFLPMPPFLSGFLTGSFISWSVAFVVYRWFFSAARSTVVPTATDFRSLPSLQVPEMKESKNTEGVFKGWMNELSEYNVDDFHINDMHSVFVTLEGSTMRLQTPKQGIPKRAMCDENVPATVNFVRQQHYDLRGCKVTLQPLDLVRKRLWSKKYPICVEIYKRPVLELQDRTIRELTKRNSLGKMEDVDAAAASEIRKDLKSGLNLTLVRSDRVTKSPAVKQVKLLYLFARSSREKEEWYRRFAAAAAEALWPTRLSDLVLRKSSPTASVKSHARTASTSSLDLQTTPHHKREGSVDSQCSGSSFESLAEADYGKLAPELNLLEYMTYMAKIMPSSSSESVATRVQTSASCSPSSPGVAESCDAQLLWLNAVISRCFLDFLREKYWTNKIRDKIQKKLSKMHVPHFIDQLTVTDIELGPQVPVICRTSKPYLDDRGLWVDMDIAYGGGFGITMETKCNLMKLKSVTPVVKEEKQSKEKRSGASYSDEEDSAESTTDEEAVEENSVDDINSDKRSEPMSKKLLKFVDKISKSRYFQQATDYRYIKKAMEEVSNTRLVLNVEMKSVTGTLAVNIPPPPTDRIWYGFRGNPNLVLSAKPRVGERDVSLSNITDWIEKKLAVEFQRVFVMPNMDDIPIPLMCDHLPTNPIATTTV